MKLLYCTECRSITSLNYDRHECFCGKCKGRYEPDGVTVVYSGPAVMLGILNRSFVEAVAGQPIKAGKGRRFEAFVIPVECEMTIYEGE